VESGGAAAMPVPLSSSSYDPNEDDAEEDTVEDGDDVDDDERASDSSSSIGPSVVVLTVDGPEGSVVPLSSRPSGSSPSTGRPAAFSAAIAPHHLHPAAAAAVPHPHHPSSTRASQVSGAAQDGDDDTETNELTPELFSQLAQEGSNSAVTSPPSSLSSLLLVAAPSTGGPPLPAAADNKARSNAPPS